MNRVAPNSMTKVTSGLNFVKRQDSGKRNISLMSKQARPLDQEKNYPMTTKENGNGSLKVQNLNTLMTNTQAMPKGSVRSTAKQTSGQKVRKLPDGVNTVQVEDLPSDISDDEWGEI